MARTIEEIGSIALGSARNLMRTAVVEIDELFGPGYAANNPALIAGFMTTAVASFQSNLISDSLDDGLRDISNELDKITKAASGWR
ncbi:hypothetical protein [Achromobacter insuavis]|uniref:hypothetical protein n=1 Tax=Achromobacter insuavis TaxID=1287735 RepID=UPI0015D17F94|nr:hypothetical protein [Achromobacter insuavis]